jgi:glucose/arabinose dehydrogenase
VSALRRFAYSAAICAALACGGGTDTTTPVIPIGDVTIQLSAIASGLSSPTYLISPAGDARLFVVEQPGRIRIIQNGTLLSQPFLDITAKVLSGGERGLLSVAFHPSYASNGFFFVYYTDLNGDIRVERYTVATNPNVADPASAKLILSIPHPGQSNHNGGLAVFGPDGMLYLGVGDGGGGGDPAGNAQNLNVLLGKLLRINVNAGDPYSIPTDNPFVNQSPRRGEIWAYGLRNPWRFTFDLTDQFIYIADVGQDRFEEVDVMPYVFAGATVGGANYGWPTMEGSSCYAASTCSTNSLALPVFTYDHSAGNCSIIGGYVYRASVSALKGAYFYSDYCSGWLRSFKFLAGAITEQHDWGIPSVGAIQSFGRDTNGELYLIAANGTVYKINILLPA